MKKLNIQQRFKAFKKEHKYNGDPIIMCMAVRGQRYKREYIRKWFRKLVNPEQYDLAELNELLDYLVVQTNQTERWE